MIDWHKISVNPNSSIKSCLTVMDESALQITLVIDVNNILCGTVTDGDIRRGLLAGIGLEEKVSKIMNANPKVGYKFESELVWLRRIHIYQFKNLPIINDDCSIVGLFQKEISPSPVITNAVVLMLGGLGSRLRPLTEYIPKPMLKVGDKPILETIVKHIAEQGFEEFYFCINYLGEQIRDYFGDGSSFGVNIHYIEETEPMGTAGALSLLPSLPTKPFIVMNGDLLTKVDLNALLRFHKKHNNAITTCVREYSQQVPYGVIEMSGQQIVQMVEKPVYRYFVNAGIYVLEPKSLAYVPNDSFYDMPTLVDDVLADGKIVGGFPITEYWMDIGQMPDYEQAQTDYEIHFQRRIKV